MKACPVTIIYIISHHRPAGPGTASSKALSTEEETQVAIKCGPPSRAPLSTQGLLLAELLLLTTHQVYQY